MEATILLCDSAQAVEGKLYILGGGWTVIGPAPAPSALAVKVLVPWTDSNRRIPFIAHLETQDGASVDLVPPGSTVPAPVVISLDFEVGRPPGLTPGTPLDATIAINLPPLPLPPGSRFVWRIEIDGVSKEHWQVAFSTRPGA